MKVIFYHQLLKEGLLHNRKWSNGWTLNRQLTKESNSYRKSPKGSLNWAPSFKVQLKKIAGCWKRVKQRNASAPVQPSGEGAGTWVNVCWRVRAAGHQEPQPHDSLFCDQLIIDPILVTFASKMLRTILFSYKHATGTKLFRFPMRQSSWKCATPF